MKDFKNPSLKVNFESSIPLSLLPAACKQAGSDWGIAGPVMDWAELSDESLIAMGEALHAILHPLAEQVAESWEAAGLTLLQALAKCLQPQYAEYRASRLFAEYVWCLNTQQTLPLLKTAKQLEKNSCYLKMRKEKARKSIPSASAWATLLRKIEVDLVLTTDQGRSLCLVATSGGFYLVEAGAFLSTSKKFTAVSLSKVSAEAIVNGTLSPAQAFNDTNEYMVKIYSLCGQWKTEVVTPSNTGLKLANEELKLTERQRLRAKGTLQKLHDSDPKRAF